MDLLTVGFVLLLLSAGGALAYWPLSLQAKAIKEDLSEAKETIEHLKHAILVERDIDDARDLAPDDELRVLLEAPSILKPPSGSSEARSDTLEDTRG